MKHQSYIIVIVVILFIFAISVNNYAYRKQSTPIKNCGFGYINSEIQIHNMRFVLLYRYYIYSGRYTYHVLTETVDTPNNSYNKLVSFCKSELDIKLSPVGIVLYSLDSNISMAFKDLRNTTVGVSVYCFNNDRSLLHYSYLKNDTGFTFHSIVKSQIASDKIYINDIRTFFLKNIRKKHPEANAYYLFTNNTYNNNFN